MLERTRRKTLCYCGNVRGPLNIIAESKPHP